MALRSLPAAEVVVVGVLGRQPAILPAAAVVAAAVAVVGDAVARAAAGDLACADRRAHLRRGCGAIAALKPRRAIRPRAFGQRLGCVGARAGFAADGEFFPVLPHLAGAARRRGEHISDELRAGAELLSTGRQGRCGGLRSVQRHHQVVSCAGAADIEQPDPLVVLGAPLSLPPRFVPAGLDAAAQPDRRRSRPACCGVAVAAGRLLIPCVIAEADVHRVGPSTIAAAQPGQHHDGELEAFRRVDGQHPHRVVVGLGQDRLGHLRPV